MDLKYQRRLCLLESMFAIKKNRVLLDFLQPTTRTCVSIKLKQVYKVKKDRRSSALKFFKDTSRVPSKHSKTITTENYPTTYSFTETELEIQ